MTCLYSEWAFQGHSSWNINVWGQGVFSGGPLTHPECFLGHCWSCWSKRASYFMEEQKCACPLPFKPVLLVARKWGETVVWLSPLLFQAPFRRLAQWLLSLSHYSGPICRDITRGGGHYLCPLSLSLHNILYVFFIRLYMHHETCNGMLFINIKTSIHKTPEYTTENEGRHLMCYTRTTNLTL